MMDTTLLVVCLVNPHQALALNGPSWTALISAARRERLLGSLAAKIKDAGLLAALPERARHNLEDGVGNASFMALKLLWEVDRLSVALASLKCPVILLKGAAYIAAGLHAGEGRLAADIDILVPRSWLGPVEEALEQEGWAFLPHNAYDDHYYREWMHELPALRHTERGTELDVHHTIVPLTTRIKPDAEALIEAAVSIGAGPLKMLCPADMVIHNIVHLFLDGDFGLGLRSLWDLRQLLIEYGEQPNFWTHLVERSKRHNVERPVAYALACVEKIFSTPVDKGALATLKQSLPSLPQRFLMQWLLLTSLRAGRGRASLVVEGVRWCLYVRGHWLKMPPLLLARHLWTKWRLRKQSPVAG